MNLSRTHNKYTIEEVAEKLKNAHPNILLLSSEYFGNKKPLLLRCKKDGHQWMANLNNLMSGWGCPRCSENEKYTLDSFKTKIKINNPDVEIIDSVYKNMHEKILCKCIHCDNTFIAKPNKLFYGQRCPLCFGKFSTEKLVGKIITDLFNVFPKKEKINENIIINNIFVQKYLIVDWSFIYDNHKIFIEYNGIQHYQITNFENSNEESSKKFKRQQMRDLWLRDYCKTNKIYLLEIDGRIYKSREYITNLLERIKHDKCYCMV